MPNTANVKFKVTNLTQTVSTPTVGISFVLGPTKRGPFANPEKKINNWSVFVQEFGGLTEDSDFPLLCKRALDRGAVLRVSRVGHYTDITNASTLEAVKAQLPAIKILTFSAAFVTDNDIDLDINGDAITTVEFDTDSNTTLANLVTEIVTHADVASATVIDGGTGTDDDRSIIIIPEDDVNVAITNILVTNGVSQPTGAETSKLGFVDNRGNLLFTIKPKHEGEDPNNFLVTVKAGSNGGTNYFDLEITNSSEDNVDEKYQNILIEGNPTVGESDYLKKVTDNSKYWEVEYQDLSSLTGQLKPEYAILQFIGGSNGTIPVDTDYTGDSAAKTGLYAFDDYDDTFQMAVPHKHSDAINTAGAAYASNRGDLQFLVNIDYTLTKAALIAKRQALTIDDKYSQIFSGAYEIFHPQTGEKVYIPMIADVLANVANGDQNYGQWYSMAGSKRGVVVDALGVYKNWGTAAAFKDLNDIANAQINVAVVKDSKAMTWGNFSGQLKNDAEAFNSIVRLILYLQKSLKPTLESFLEEPNDIPTWKAIYYTVFPFMESLLDNRALFSYEWQGDQDANSLSDLQVNNEADVRQGKYKINLLIKEINSMQEIDVNIILTPAGVSFETTSGELL